VQKLEDEEIRHDIDRRGAIAQFFEDFADPLFGPHRESDVDDIDFARFGELKQIVEIAEALADMLRQFGAAFGRAVVEESAKLEPQLRRGFDILGELNAEVIDAHDREAASVVTARAKDSLQGAHHDAHRHGGERRRQQPNESRAPRKRFAAAKEVIDEEDDAQGAGPREQCAQQLALARYAAPVAIQTGHFAREEKADEGAAEQHRQRLRPFRPASVGSDVATRGGEAKHDRSRVREAVQGLKRRPGGAYGAIRF
jgi:hypothetical protein